MASVSQEYHIVTMKTQTINPVVSINKLDGGII